MMAVVRTPVPVWYWVIAVLLLLWALAGVASFYAHLSVDQAALAQMTDYDRRMFQSLPGWFAYDFALATLTGLAGAVALLARRAVAMPLYLFSLIGVVIQFGWVLGATDLIAHKGFLTAAGFPIVIVALAVFAYGFASLARGRRWIG
jgi:hypothetical protein